MTQTVHPGDHRQANSYGIAAMHLPDGGSRSS